MMPYVVESKILKYCKWIWNDKELNSQSSIHNPAHNRYQEAKKEKANILLKEK